MLIGTLVNAVIPASAGDVAKVQIVANRYGLSRTGLITGRGAESIVDALIMVMFIAISFALPEGGRDRWFEMHVEELRPPGRGAVVVQVDVTQRRQAATVRRR
jgi:hypothetical protein